MAKTKKILLTYKKNYLNVYTVKIKGTDCCSLQNGEESRKA